ncbi:MAG TPA: hypothetical protein V6D13_03110 [Halomicronema sp.]
MNTQQQNQPIKQHETPEELQALARTFIVGIAWSMAGLFEENRPKTEQKRAGP